MAFELTTLINYISALNFGIITNEIIGILVALVIAYLMAKEVTREGMGVLPALLLMPVLGFTVGAIYGLVVIIAGLYFAISLIVYDGFQEYETSQQW